MLLTFVSSIGMNLILARTVSADETTNTRDELAKFSKAFFSKYCTQCHGSEAQEADIRFDKPSFDLKDAATSDLWARIFAQVQFAEMPPEDVDDRPTAHEREQFLTLIDRELSRYGRGMNVKEKMLLPEYGSGQTLASAARYLQRNLGKALRSATSFVGQDRWRSAAWRQIHGS
ncbi:MAG: hypothetical protein CMJ78_11995 [Planctomycetaceae bacterium]|nr:hypothetical protein [Planctomycetaceae bacterium]